MFPEEKRLYEIACAKHLLNAFGQRGLTSLTYGCDEEKVKQDAIQRNHDFRLKQVVDYNQRNETRKMMNLGYLPPTPYIKQCAMDLGIRLLEPYNVREEERAGISDAKKENEALKAEMSELKAMMKQLMESKQPGKSEPRLEVAEPSVSEEKGDYACPHCRRAFPSEADLNLHMGKYHKGK